MGKRGARGLGLSAVVLVALVLRLGFVFAAPGELVGDALYYHGHARGLAAGAGYETVDGSPAINWVPGWPLLLAALVLIFGDGVKAGMILNALLGACTAGLLAVLGTRLFDRRVGLTAGLVYALWPANVFFAATLMTEVTFNFFLVSSLLTLVLGVSASAVKRDVWLVSSGVSLGIAALVKGEPLVLAPLYLLFLGSSLGSARQLVRCASALFLAVALTLAPWGLRNYMLFDQVIVTSGGGGATFWKAHHPDSTGLNDHAAAARYRRLHQRPTVSQTTLAVNSAGWRDGWRFIRTHPAEELRLAWRKLALTYGNDAVAVAFAAGDHGFDPATRARLVKIANGFWYAVMALAGLGLVTLRNWRPATRILVLGVPATWIALHLAFLGGARYHVPETPAYALLAACGIGWVARRSWRRCFRKLLRQWQPRPPDQRHARASLATQHPHRPAGPTTTSSTPGWKPTIRTIPGPWWRPKRARSRSRRQKTFPRISPAGKASVCTLT